MSTEHGPGTDDEVNLLSAGSNYGWNPRPGQLESAPMTDTVNLPFAKKPLWSSDAPTVGPSGATFVVNRRSVDWGSMNGAFVVALLKAKRLQLLFLDDTDAVIRTDTLLATENARLRSVTEGPDGLLYVSTDGGAYDPSDVRPPARTCEIWRIEPARRRKSIGQTRAQ